MLAIIKIISFLAVVFSILVLSFGRRSQRIAASLAGGSTLTLFINLMNIGRYPYPAEGWDMLILAFGSATWPYFLSYLFCAQREGKIKIFFQKISQKIEKFFHKVGKIADKIEAAHGRFLAWFEKFVQEH